ncbi:MAG: DUF411 domain-containing protein [Sphingorhabdus sp.]
MLPKPARIETSALSRREMIAALAAIPLLQACASTAPARITVYRDPGCGCCDEWTRQIRTAFATEIDVIDTADRGALHQQAGMPASLASCHTAMIEGLAFEGHVPSADIKRFLKERPAGYKGLAVPGMPNGSPGMEGPEPPDHFAVIAFGNGITNQFAVY